MINPKSKRQNPKSPEAAILKAIRTKLGYNQPDWAAALGVTVRTVSRWETGSAKPQPLALRAIAQLASSKKARGSRKRPTPAKKAIPDLTGQRQ